ncbi:MAG: poly-beta-1,6 N-acetyl-D-glucosamine export porin PgaA [Corticimicrobacter sp.]
MNPPSPHWAAFFVAAISSALPMSIPAAPVTPQHYEQLIHQARTGEHDAALDYLRTLDHGAHRSDGQANRLRDHVLIASWAGLDDEVIDLYQRYAQDRHWTPDMLGAAARALRFRHHWSQAEILYARAMQAAPQDPQLRAGHILTQADAGKLAQAMPLARTWLAQSPDAPLPHLVLAYVQSQAGQDYDAWHTLDLAHARWPDDRQIITALINAMQTIGLSVPALALAASHPGLLDAAAHRDLELDAVAGSVRLSSLPTRSETERFEIADRALQRYDRLLADWSRQLPETQDAMRRARLDRLDALASRLQWRAVAQEYEALAADAAIDSPYVLRLAGSAYLELRQPEHAIPCFEQALARLTQDDEERMLAELGLFYALVETEDFERAYAVVAEANRRDTRLSIAGQPELQPNARRLDTQLATDMADLYANATDRAVEKLEALLRRAPGNQHLHIALAESHRARMWPRHAERRLKIAEALAPRDIPLMTGQGLTALELREWRQTDMLAAETLRRDPDSWPVKRLNRLFDVYRKAELRISGHRGLSNDSPVSGNGDYSVDAVIYTPPIDYDWRAFAGLGRAYGRFEEGNIGYDWQRAGVERRSRDLWLEGEISRNSYGQGHRTGLRLAAAYDLDDHWQLGGEAALLARDTPLRALRNGIRSNGLSLFARWLGSERQQWRMEVGTNHFGDGNQRYRWALTGQTRLYTRPHVSIDALWALEASRNSQSDTPYYSPRADLDIAPALQVSHILYRRYETVWEQVFQAGAGAYVQRDYGTAATGLIGYGQRLRMHDVFEAGLMVTATSRPYDGVRERETHIQFDLNYRF